MTRLWRTSRQIAGGRSLHAEWDDRRAVVDGSVQHPQHQHANSDVCWGFNASTGHVTQRDLLPGQSDAALRPNHPNRLTGWWS